MFYFLGNDHLVQYNEICRGLTASQDGGVIETRQNMSMLGNKIRFNYLHHNERGSPDHNAQNCTIYLDNCTHGVEVFGNVFYRNIGRTVKPWNRAQIGVTEGHNHVIANNLFIDNPGFVDEAAGDFSLRPDSRVFKEIPGFVPIPFEKMRRAKILQEANQ